MIIFRDEQSRRIERKRALGMKVLVIEEDVTMGDEVDMRAEDGQLVIFKKTEQLEEGVEPVYTFITDEIGLYGLNKGVKSMLEIKLCDDVMVVNLIAGSIVIRPEGKELKAIRGVEAKDLPACNTKEIKWISVEDILSYAKSFAEYSDMFPFDYEYVVEIGGELGANGFSSFKIKKSCEAYDISGGALAIKADELARKEDAREAKKMANTFTKVEEESAYSFDDDDEDEDDDDDDNDSVGYEGYN